jgi:hypothetical protein
MMPPRSKPSERRIVRNISAIEAQARSAFVPAEFLDDVDVAECALDDQLEQLHRQYAAASRACSRAKFELESLELRDDIHAHILAQAQSARLMRAINALEERLERPEND